MMFSSIEIKNTHGFRVSAKEWCTSSSWSPGKGKVNTFLVGYAFEKPKVC